MENYDNLPTAEEYKALIESNVNVNKKYSEPKYRCPKCRGGMCRNETMTLTSCPPMYLYKCNTCGNVEYQYG